MTPEFLAEVLRINDRYIGEFVERFNLCPFAKLTRERGALFREVMDSEDLARAIAVLEAWEQEARLEIGMLIFPLTQLDAVQFDRFTGRLREQYERPRGIGAPLVLAPFHRRAGYGQKSPAQMTMYWRRAPDPFIQVVPIALLRAVRGNNHSGKFLFDGSASALAELERRARHPSLTEHIAKENYDRLAEPGLPALQATLDAIYADRDAAYARLGYSG